MKLAAVLACRNQSSRLYAKPLQNLDVKNNITILDYLIAQLQLYPEISNVVLAISEKKENLPYVELAELRGIPYVLGDDDDVLARLISGAELVEADHVFRVTTESPYTYLDNLSEIYNHHCSNNIDYSGTKGLPDGSFFEIIGLNALKKSWAQGDNKHRSELCTLYINENADQFRIAMHDVPDELRRSDIRLTVDWPEDLIVLRNVFEGTNLESGVKLDLRKIIRYLNENPKINAINNWIDSGIGRIWY